MEVVIREKTYEYESDYRKRGGDDGWHYSAGDCYKFPVRIGRSNCFIKRFEKKTPESISGWGLMNDLKAHYEPGLPRLHDIVATKEDGKTIYYVFYEHLEGCTLDSAIQKGMPVDLEKLVGDIFLALDSIHRQGYWFADFCEKNIFCNTAGRYFLIDLDSAQPASAVPENDMYADKEYWALAFTYIVHEVGVRAFKPAHISGILLNYLQVIFLVLRTKVSLIDARSENRSVELFDTLPHLLEEWAPECKSLFKTLLEGPSRMPGSSDVQRIKDMLLEKIVLRTGAYSLDIRPTVRKESGREPVIRSFRSDKKTVGSREDFRLEWVVDRADEIQLYRYKVLLKKLESGAGGITLSEMYDGQDKEVRYTLSVHNEYGHAKSEPVHIVVREAGPADDTISKDGQDTVTRGKLRPVRDPEPERERRGGDPELKRQPGADPKPGKRQEGKARPGWMKTRPAWSKTRGLKTILLVILGVLLAGGVLAYWLMGSVTVKAGLFGFQPKTMNGPGEVILYGEHFPANKNGMKVLFNTSAGTIQSATDEKLVVQLPSLGDKELRLAVKLVIGGDTIIASEELQYLPLTAVKVDSEAVIPVAKAEKHQIGEDKDPHPKPSHDTKHPQPDIPKVDNPLVTPPPVQQPPYNADKDTADIAPVDKAHAILEAKLVKDSVKIVTIQYKKTLGVFGTRIKKLFSNESSLTLDRVKLQFEQEDGSGSEIRILQKVRPYEKRLLIDDLPRRTTLKVIIRNIHLQK